MSRMSKVEVNDGLVAVRIVSWRTAVIDKHAKDPSKSVTQLFSRSVYNCRLFSFFSCIQLIQFSHFKKVVAVPQ